MSLSTLIQIPCHHVLANENALNLKYRMGLKQFFNINLGIGIIKKLLFLFIFSTYLRVLLLKFWSGEFVGCGICGIKFRIQWVPTRQKYAGYRGPSKVCRVGTCWMHNFILHPRSSLDQNLSKNTGRYVKNTNKKSSFFYDTYPQIYIKEVFKTYTVFQI